ncbi:O-phosphoseryl-tRNA(Sec) selenium transferase [Sergentomyia squamirostris]
MNKDHLRGFYKSSPTKEYVENALFARRHRDKLVEQLLEKKKWPEEGWDEFLIDYVLRELSLMDTNQFPYITGVGEREGRVFSSMVARRHYGFSHGIGRSGDLAEAQPKAIGSTILSDITNSMLLDLVKVAGMHAAKQCILMPMATGMTLMFCLLHIQRLRGPMEENGVVLWSRIDQKSTFKSITSAGLTPLIIDTKRKGDLLVTNLHKFREAIKSHGAGKVACIMSTTSCFAPRSCDDIIELAKLAKEYNIPHVVNNAYGLQSSLCCHQIEQAVRLGGRIDFVVQSTDKNLMVPVGGSIVVAFDGKKIDQLAKSYPGRASISQTIDVFVTLLEMGEKGFKKLVKEQKKCYEKLQEALKKIAEEFDEKVYDTPKGNRISLAFSLFNCSDLATELGSRLFRRGITGARVVPMGEVKTIEGYTFRNWGSHCEDSGAREGAYLTVAAAIGCQPDEVDTLCEKLRPLLREINMEIMEKMRSFLLSPRQSQARCNIEEHLHSLLLCPAVRLNSAFLPGCLISSTEREISIV